jgi:hypothetical protein
MAITRLTDFITVATNKWTYGDSAFKYEGEVNQNHDTVYPLMVIEPPSSRMPDIYEGWEHYQMEIEFYNTYQTATSDAITLQQRWDKLQDLALEWLDNVLINYSGGVITNPSTNQSPTPTQVYIDKETLQIERIKNNKNDKLCRITMRFDMRMFTRCFTPQSFYPNTVPDLVVWLRADSNATYSIPTKKLSAWGDCSGQGNDVSQSDTTKQPLRYGFDKDVINGGFDESPRINFPATVGGPQPEYHLVSDNNAPITGNDFTIFTTTNLVINLVVPLRSIYGYTDTASGAKMEIGQGVGSDFESKVTDGSGNTITATTGAANLLLDCLMVSKLDGDTLSVQAWDSAGEHAAASATTAGFDATGEFDDTNFSIGGLLGAATNNWVEMETPEILVYNRALSSSEISQVKYKIY